MLLKSAFLCCLFLIGSTTPSHRPPEGYEHYLGTRTPYRVVANRNDSQLQFEHCTPTKVWMLVRHGTRNPSAKLIKKMRERLPQIRDLIAEANIASLLEKWGLYISEQDQKLLTHEGEEEMLFLARRMQRRFPDVFGAKYSNSSYKFKFTATQRTQESARYFAAGLFGVENADAVWFPEPSTKDPILRFYKLCTKWIKDVKKDPKTKIEQKRFQNTTVVAKTVEEINKKLGLNNQLNFDDVHLMYQTCAFETAWNENTKSPWCLPFSIEAIKIMEYHEDLKYYWIDGYGHELTYKQACPAFNDMLNFMKSETLQPKAVVYFTHSGSILKMLAHLSLYKELQHLVHMEQNVKEDRKWKVSKIDAFGTNLAFVLHKCDGKDKLLLLHQEHVIRFPSCADSDLCDLDVLERDFNDSINSCSFNQICDNKTAEDD